MLTKEIIETVEKDSNIQVNDEDTYWSIQVDNPCGEDFSFDIDKTEDNHDIEQIISYCDDFDPEEHAQMWLGGKGAPGMRQLLDNSDNIKESLNQLACQLRDFL